MTPHDAPIYLQVAEALRQRILAGVLRAGDQLPSEPDLAVEFDVGKDTIRDALARLRAEGLIETRRGYRSRVREQGEREPVVIAAGTRVVARMPTPDERRESEVPDGVPVLVVGDRVYRADRYVIVAE